MRSAALITVKPLTHWKALNLVVEIDFVFIAKMRIINRSSV